MTKLKGFSIDAHYDEVNGMLHRSAYDTLIKQHTGGHRPAVGLEGSFETLKCIIFNEGILPGKIIPVETLLSYLCNCDSYQEPLTSF